MKLFDFLRLDRLLLTVIVLLLLIVCSMPASAACVRENSDRKLLTLTGQAAATVTSADQDNCVGRGVVVVVDLTTMTTATVTVTVQGKDSGSGKYVALLTSAALSSVATTTLTLYPGVTTSANVAVSGPLPNTWRVSVVVANNGGTAAATGTIGASLIQ